MDNEVFKEFVKTLGRSVLKTILLVGGLLGTLLGLVFIGLSPDIAAVTLFAGLSLGFLLWSLAKFYWDQAKAKVEYKRQFGKDL